MYRRKQNRKKQLNSVSKSTEIYKDEKREQVGGWKVRIDNKTWQEATNFGEFNQ